VGYKNTCLTFDVLPVTGQTFVIPAVIEDTLEAPVCARPFLTNTWGHWLQTYKVEIIITVSAIVMGMAALQSKLIVFVIILATNCY
jgi:hypothetical protein